MIQNIIPSIICFMLYHSSKLTQPSTLLYSALLYKGIPTLASVLAQSEAVQASQHAQTAAEVSQPTPLAPEGIPTLASALAQSEAVQASQHAQTAAEASQPTPPAPKGIPTHQRVLAQIAAVQASQLSQAGASQPRTPAHKYEGRPARAKLPTRLAAVQGSQRKQTATQASQPAPKYKGTPARVRLLAHLAAVEGSQRNQIIAQASQPAPPAPKDIPARARVSPVACPRTSSSAADAPLLPSLLSQLAAGQVSQPTPPAPKVSEPNATTLNLFQAIDYRGLDRVKDNPQLRASRALVQANPRILEPMLEELGRQNPDVRQCIQDNQAEFMQDMLQPPQRPVGNLSNQSADAIPQEMTFTLEEREAIDREDGSASLHHLQQG
ncbi:UV excision repair protein Rad23 protein [Dioscorea alata]|uniref:UV excision repair protein Rad23 protein n=1 Tax=Dioscorea alata TaxID=55571 RepID=A0ACB7VYV2_DIOAL|nr:UV excision repair protein Rad23 protein [Dioscorea alata]